MVESYGPFPMNSRCVYWALLTVDKIMGSAISLLSRTSTVLAYTSKTLSKMSYEINVRNK